MERGSSTRGRAEDFSSSSLAPKRRPTHCLTKTAMLNCRRPLKPTLHFRIMERGRFFLRWKEGGPSRRWHSAGFFSQAADGQPEGQRSRWNPRAGVRGPFQAGPASPSLRVLALGSERCQQRELERTRTQVRRTVRSAFRLASSPPQDPQFSPPAAPLSAPASPAWRSGAPAGGRKLLGRPRSPGPNRLVRGTGRSTERSSLQRRHLVLIFRRV